MAELATSYTILPSNDSTLAIDVCRSGLRRRRKHILFFEQFKGDLTFARDDLSAFTMTLAIDTSSVACFDASLSEKKRRKIAEFARTALSINGHPEIQFTSTSLRAKPLRGYVMEGVLQVRGITRIVKLNAVLSSVRKDTLQLDGDTTVRLSDFDLPRPSSLFGLFTTKDEASVRILLWATPTIQSARATSSLSAT